MTTAADEAIDLGQRFFREVIRQYEESRMTTAAEEVAFLAAICANPADDTARLVYADWLQEHGREERAEFIRGQNAVFRTSGPGLYARGLLNDRERQLLEWHRVWRECYGFSHAAWMSCAAIDWERGFIESVACTAADWLANGDAILAAHPVTRVRLTTMPELLHDWDRELVWFVHDPSGRRFTYEEARPQLKADDYAPNSSYLTVLRCRFGTRVTFTLPAPTYIGPVHLG